MRNKKVPIQTNLLGAKNFKIAGEDVQGKSVHLRWEKRVRSHSSGRAWGRRGRRWLLTPRVRVPTKNESRSDTISYSPNIDARRPSAGIYSPFRGERERMAHLSKRPDRSFPACSKSWRHDARQNRVLTKRYNDHAGPAAFTEESSSHVEHRANSLKYNVKFRKAHVPICETGGSKSSYEGPISLGLGGAWRGPLARACPNVVERAFERRTLWAREGSSATVCPR